MYAFLIFDVFPKSKDTTVLHNFLQDIEKHKKTNEDITIIFPSAWMLDLKNGLSTLRNILQSADQFGISYKLSFIEEKLQFIT